MRLFGKLIRSSSRCQFYRRRKRILAKKRKIKTIAVIYFVPKSNTEKYNNWEDGFTKAIDLLSEDFDITRINLEDTKPSAEDLNKFDFLIIKSCWNWIVDNYVKSLKNLTTLKGIVVSCSKPPKTDDIWRYDVIWYQTLYYEKFIKEHPNRYLSFGINSDVFKPMDIPKEIDVLSIGAVTGYKRFEKLNDYKGIRVIIGSTNAKDSDEVKSKLHSDIEIIDYVSQEELAKYINSSKLVYLPCETEGGGERAVMEAMACGVEVKVEEDNLKLKSLVKRGTPFLIQDYYSGLMEGLNSFSKNKK